MNRGDSDMLFYVFDYKKDIKNWTLKRKKTTRGFKDLIDNDRHIRSSLIDEDFKDIENYCRKKYFLEWTGREFELEVDD